VPAGPGAIARWIHAAQEKVADAKQTSVSLGTRFEAVYDAVFCSALVVLNASGWRHRSVPGHHAFVLEGACAVIGTSETLFDRLGALRDLRNQKYDGMARSAADVAEALRLFEQFSTAAGAWLQAKHPALLH
jgi:hypothetical protein